MSDPAELIEILPDRAGAADDLPTLLRSLIQKVQLMTLNISRLTKAISDNTAAHQAHVAALEAKNAADAAAAAKASSEDAAAIDGAASSIEAETATTVAATAQLAPA